jgi:hypothetical protein
MRGTAVGDGDKGGFGGDVPEAIDEFTTFSLSLCIELIPFPLFSPWYFSKATRRFVLLLA